MNILSLPPSFSARLSAPLEGGLLHFYSVSIIVILSDTAATAFTLKATCLKTCSCDLL